MPGRGTQSEVIEAFINGEDRPSRASNMRCIEGEIGGRRYLCGGRNGKAVVLAKYEPIDTIYVYNNYSFNRSLGNNAVNGQRLRVRREVARAVPDDQYHRLSERPPETDDIEDLDL